MYNKHFKRNISALSFAKFCIQFHRDVNQYLRPLVETCQKIELFYIFPEYLDSQSLLLFHATTQSFIRKIIAKTFVPFIGFEKCFILVFFMFDAIVIAEINLLEI